MVIRPIAARMCCKRTGEACIILIKRVAEFLNHSDMILLTLMVYISINHYYH